MIEICLTNCRLWSIKQRIASVVKEEASVEPCRSENAILARAFACASVEDANSRFATSCTTEITVKPECTSFSVAMLRFSHLLSRGAVRALLRARVKRYMVVGITILASCISGGKFENRSFVTRAIETGVRKYVACLLVVRRKGCVGRTITIQCSSRRVMQNRHCANLFWLHRSFRRAEIWQHVSNFRYNLELISHYRCIIFRTALRAIIKNVSGCKTSITSSHAWSDQR